MMLIIFLFLPHGHYFIKKSSNSHLCFFCRYTPFLLVNIFNMEVAEKNLNLNSNFINPLKNVSSSKEESYKYKQDKCSLRTTTKKKGIITKNNFFR